jgi:phosphatidylserine decarboxylase
MTFASYAAAQILRVLPRARITRAVGRLCDAELHPALANAVVGLYVRAYKVDLEEAVRPNGSYPSFDAFFTRALREGARHVATDAEVVSPADGRLVAAGRVDSNARILVKGQGYRVEDLVGDPDGARRYEGGQFAVVYLSPRDYHRVHAPVAGAVSVVRSMPGDYFPVNSIGERHVPQLFARNRRVAIGIDTASLGRVTVVMVAAMVVGRITVNAVPGRDVPLGLHVLEPPVRVDRGDEIGVFRLGSTAVVLAERGAGAAWFHEARAVRMGEPLGPTPASGAADGAPRT